CSSAAPMASRIRGKRCCLHTSREARATKRRRESGGEAPSRKPQAASSKIQRSSKSQASRSKFQDQDPRSKIQGSSNAQASSFKDTGQSPDRVHFRAHGPLWICGARYL